MVEFKPSILPVVFYRSHLLFAPFASFCFLIITLYYFPSGFIFAIILFISNSIAVWSHSVRSRYSMGTWVAQWVKPLPFAQVMISGSWDRALHQALCSAGSLLPPLSLPASLPACDLSLCQINKLKKILKKNVERQSVNERDLVDLLIQFYSYIMQRVRFSYHKESENDLASNSATS